MNLTLDQKKHMKAMEVLGSIFDEDDICTYSVSDDLKKVSAVVMTDGYKTNQTMVYCDETGQYKLAAHTDIGHMEL